METQRPLPCAAVPSDPVHSLPVIPSTRLAIPPIPREALLERPAFFTFERDVAIQDVDAAGIVFHAQTIAYLNDALLASWKHFGVDLARALVARSWGTPVRSVEVEFLAPLRYGLTARVEVVQGQRSETEMRVGYRLWSDAQTLALVGQVRYVFVDGQLWKRTASPAEMEPWLRALDPVGGHR